MLRRRDKNKEEVIATFSHLENIQIGKNNFTNDDLRKYFAANETVLNSEKSAIILLKQVFQKEYPITRIPNDKSLPRVPTKAEEKSKLIECMRSYFNYLRSRIIIKKYKTGDSASLREMLSELQSIKVLIEHFEETKESFPYHMFAAYLSNADFINLKGDINSQMRGLESKKVQDERIRNLLRQFTVTYLKNIKSKRFVLNDPGVSESQYEDEDVGIPPPILEGLLAFINNKNTIFKNNESYNESYNEDITSYLKEMRDNIDKLKAKRDSINVTSGGGSSETIRNQLDEIQNSYNDLFYSMFNKYNDLLTTYNRFKTSEDCQKDLAAIQDTLEEERAKIANSEDTLKSLNEEKANLESKIRELEGVTREKDELNSKQLTELGLLRSELATCKADLVTAQNILDANKDVIDSAESARGLSQQVADLTATLEKARQDSNSELASQLEEQRKQLQEKADLALTKLTNEQDEIYNEIQYQMRSQQERYVNMIEEKDSQIKAAENLVTEREVTIASLETNLTNLTNKSQSQEEVVQNLTNDLAAASRTISEATAKATSDASQAEADLQAAKEETRLARAELERLETSFQGAQRLQEERLREVNNLTGEKAAVMRELEEVKSQALRDQAKAKSDAAEEKQRNLEEVARVASETAKSQKLINDANIAEISRLSSEITNLKASEVKIKEIASNAIKQLKNMHKDDLQKLNDKIESQNATIKEIEDLNSKKLEALNTRIAELSGEGLIASEELKAAKAELNATNTNIKKLNQKYEKSLETYENVKQKLETCEESIRTKTEETTRLEEKIKNLERSVGKAQAELEAAIQREKASASKSQSEISAAKRDVDEARKQLAEAEQRVSIFQAESERKDIQIDQVRRENKKVVSERDKANEKELASRRSAAQAEESRANALAEVARLSALENSARKKEEEAKAATRAALEAVSEAEGRASEAEGRASEAEERASQASTERNAALATASEAEARARAQAALVVATKAEKDAAVNLANQRTAAAEAARKAAEDKTRESQQAAKEAEAKVIIAEKAKREADNRLSQARDQLRFTTERADLAEQRADKSDKRVEKYVARAIGSEKGKREAENALNRAKEAEQTAVEARSAAESARDEAIQRAETAERNAEKALQEAQASKIRQEKLVEINSKIVGLEEEVEALRSSVIELDQRIVDANEEIKSQQQLISELKKNKKTVFGAIREGFDTVAPYLGVGGKNDTLLEYCNKVAEDSLNTFLLEEPLPFFSLIKDFEKGSKMDIFKTTNEEYILKLFIKHHLEEHFNSKEMKEFYFHAKEIFGKQDCSEYAKMFFVLNEIINVIRSSKDDIDIVRIKSKEYNSSFDYLEYILQDYEYDFYTIAKKKFVLDNSDLKVFNLTFIKENIYISLNKGNKTYDFNKNLTLTRKDFDFKSEIYFISSHMVYLFFILSTHFYLQSENMIDTDEYFTVSNNLEKTVRKLKRTKNKEKKSIAKLFKERKEFKLDG